MDTDMSGAMEKFRPLKGQVVHIKTVQESRPTEEFADAYVAEVNVKSASAVVKALDAAFPRDLSLSLQHLRRFAKRDNLPEHLQSPVILSEERDSASGSQAQTIHVLISPPLPEISALQTVLAPFAPSSVSSSDGSVPAAVPLRSTRIPLQPPLNPRQAEQWSRTLWPVAFNPAAQRALVAPPPQILNKTRESIQPRAGYYLALARKVGSQAKRSGRGRGVGVVVVDPEIEVNDNDDAGWMNAVVAVAGDARYSRREAGQPSLFESQSSGDGPNPASRTYNPDLEGGPELHALMRAVDMVASRRREDDQATSGTASEAAESLMPPLTQIESYFLYPPSPSSPDPSSAQPSTSRIRPRSLGGYLCTALDVYITHEPCLSCSMGILLSRFRAIVFPRKGRIISGGLASEPVVTPILDSESDEKEVDPAESKSIRAEEDRNYYGLHWRKELNWRALGYEFVEDDTADDNGGDDGSREQEPYLKEEVVFHA